jgi:L-rhamnose mutarotase
MLRQALVLKLKPGKLEEYIYHHDRIPTEWPRLHAALKDSGIHSIRTFAAEPLLFLYADVEDEGAFPRLWDTDAHKEWANVMDPLIELDAEMRPDARFIKQIFNFEA